jgi:tetratricopeptide (TPR) repeat protein
MSKRLTRSFLFLVTLALPLALKAQDQGVLETTSLLGQKLYAQTDNDSVTAAKSKVTTGSPTTADYLTLSHAEAGRRQYQESVKTDTEALTKFPNNADLLLDRGHRELGLRQFAAAQKDLEHAVQVDPTSLDSHYHLGLAHYFQGQFAEAAGHLGQARDLAKSDDSLIDCTAWLYVSLRRAGKEQEAETALARITPSIHNTEPHLLFYLHLLRFYQGRMTEAQVLPAKPAPGDTEAELSFNTINYGVGNWHLYHHEKPLADTFFRKAVTGEAWNSWGFIGSEVELSRK